MVGLMCCVVKRGEDVFAFQEWVVRQDLVVGSSRAEQFEHIGNTDTQSAYARSPAALTGFDGDSIEALKIHEVPI